MGHLLPLVILVLACAACEAPPDPRRTNFEIRGKDGVAKYDPKTGRLKRLEFDQDKNGKMESVGYYDATTLISFEIDKDEDGKVDRWEYFGPNSTLERVGSSSRDDEIQDTWAYPDSAGFLAKVESDTDRDGVIDKRELFVPRPGETSERILSVVEFGLDKDGRASLRLHYGPDGQLQKTERR